MAQTNSLSQLDTPAAEKPKTVAKKIDGLQTRHEEAFDILTANLNRLPKESGFLGSKALNCELSPGFSSPILIDLFGLGNPDLLSGDVSWKKGRDVVAKTSAYRVFDMDLSGIGRSLPPVWEWVGPRSGILVHWPEAAPKEEAYPLTLDGSYLFGNHTLGRTGSDAWAHGYQPLATLDNDANGNLTGDELAPVWIWVDANSDALVDLGEMKPASEYVQSLAVIPEVDSEGNAQAPKGAVLKNGKSVPTWDWWSHKWQYNSNTDFFTVKNRVTRTPYFAASDSGFLYPSYLYYWSVVGGEQSGFLRFLSVGDDTYVFGAPSNIVAGKSGYKTNVFRIRFSKVTKSGDGVWTWEFKEPIFGDSDKAVVSVLSPGVISGSNVFIQDDRTRKYDWVAEPFLGEVTPQLAPLRVAFASFTSAQFQVELETNPDAVDLLLKAWPEERASAALLKGKGFAQGVYPLFK